MSEVKVDAKKHRGIYLLPNLFTTANLFAGFYAVIGAMNGHFENAAIAIFIAMVLDGLDGRVARMTNTQSAFGAEYDSLADMLTFCTAPALITYTWAMQDLGDIGWLAAFLYVAGGALRLARFNTQVGIADKRYFQGLASPSAAGITAGMVWFCHDLGIGGEDISYLVALVTGLAGVLMVSNFRYSSFKELDMKGKVPFMAALMIVVIFVIIATYPSAILFGGFVIYAVSGPFLTIRKAKKLRVEDVIGDDDDADFDNNAR